MDGKYDDADPVPVPPTPIPPTPNLPKKYIMLNAINWSNLTGLPLTVISEATYFVLEVLANGSLVDRSNGTIDKEKKFIADVKAAGKKVTFSVAGGTQSVADVTAAVNQKTNFINAIADRIKNLGYDGVTLDVENTNISPQNMVDFVNALRAKLDTIRPGLIIGCYTQPYQLTTVWSKLELCAAAITWLSPMMYDRQDSPYNAAKWTAETNAWSAKIPKSKLLYGLAVNYVDWYGGVLNTKDYAECFDTVIKEGWAGIGIWRSGIYTQPFIDVQKSKIII